MRTFLCWLLSLLLSFGTATPVLADTLSITAWSQGDSLNAVNLNSRMTTIVNWSTAIANDNISSTAAIVGSKLDLTSGVGRISHSTSVTSDAPVFTSAQTWDNAAAVFSLWRGTVTNTNSASTSRLIDLRVGSTIIASISRVGQLMLTPQDYASGPSTLLEGAYFNVASATYTDNMTATSGTAPRFIAYAFQRPALAAANTSVTTTHAATVFIASAPVTSTNMTLTNRYALWVDQGDVRIGGGVYASAASTLSAALFMTSNAAIVPSGLTGTPVANGLYRDNVVKGWVKVTPSGGVYAADANFNVSSITDGSTGVFTIVWDLDFANANYALAAMCTGGRYASYATAPAAASAAVEVRLDSNTLSDDACSVIAIGGQ